MPARRRVLAGAARVVAAALIATAGWIHLHLWMAGYSQIAVIGPLFLLFAAASGLAVLAVLATGRRPVLAAAALLELGAVGALALASTTGLFGFRETGVGVQGYLMGAYAAESAAVVFLALGWLARPRAGKGPRSRR